MFFPLSNALLVEDCLNPELVSNDPGFAFQVRNGKSDPCWVLLSWFGFYFKLCWIKPSLQKGRLIYKKKNVRCLSLVISKLKHNVSKI